MRTIKCIVSALVCLCVVFSLCGCTIVINKIKYETKDLNGEEDHSLAVFTDEDICAEDYDCYCYVYGFSPSGEKSYSDEDIWHDADLIDVTAGTPLSGVSLLQATYGKEDTVVFTVECDRTAGNLRVVLLNENGQILYDFDLDETSSYTVEGAKGKEFEIRLAGESAEFDIIVTREFIAG